MAVIHFENYIIQLVPVSFNFWQSEILDGDRRLMGCTCSRNSDSSLACAKRFIQSALVAQTSAAQQYAPS